MTELSPGRILASRFELRRLLGRGGMGQVWLAVDSELGEQVAVKVLRPNIRAQFRRDIGAFRFIARGIGDAEFYVLAGVGSAVALGVQFYLFRTRRGSP